MESVIRHILLARQIVVGFYKRYENAFLFIFRLLAGVFVFRFINSIGMYREEFLPLFTPPLDFPYIVLSALLFAILPPTLANGLIMLELLIQISQSLEVAVFVFLLLVCVLVFYARLQPKRSFLVLAIIIASHFNMQYAVVIFSGLYLGLGSIIPIVIGTFIYHFIPVFAALVKNVVTPETIDIMALPETFMGIYRTIYMSFTSPDNFGWIFIGFTFAMVIITVYAISRLTVNYAKDYAVILGGTANIIAGVIGVLLLNQHFDILILTAQTIISVIIVEIVRFFDSVLDYKKAERVQFEDEENYYYVKIIPKIIIPVNEKEDVPVETTVKKPVPSKPAPTPVRAAKPLAAEPGMIKSTDGTRTD